VFCTTIHQLLVFCRFAAVLPPADQPLSPAAQVCTIFNTRYAQGTKNSKLCALRVFVFNLVGGYAALGIPWFDYYSD
jgi:hypothetical protein